MCSSEELFYAKSRKLLIISKASIRALFYMLNFSSLLQLYMLSYILLLKYTKKEYGICRTLLKFLIEHNMLN